jgi:hypothetical protein
MILFRVGRGGGGVVSPPPPPRPAKGRAPFFFSAARSLADACVLIRKTGFL